MTEVFNLCDARDNLLILSTVKITFFYLFTIIGASLPKYQIMETFHNIQDKATEEYMAALSAHCVL
jgi:hypothetical protein